MELRAGNPSGIMTAGAVIESKNGKPFAKSAIFYRTFRPLMRGEVLNLRYSEVSTYLCSVHNSSSI